MAYQRMGVLGALALCWAMTACSGTPLPPEPPSLDGGHDVGPDAGEPDACTPACDGKECGDDGCGGTCHSCPSGERCNESTFTCECEETPAQACERLEFDCGTVTLSSACGDTLT